VNVEHVSSAPVRGRDHVGLGIGTGYETYVAKETFVEDLVDGGAVIDCALRFADYAGAGSGVR
jgi:hypothetical protein